jgi:hypothetical protein
VRGSVAACFVLLTLPLVGGSIEGRVTNSVTGEGVIGAKARFLDRHSYVYETITDGNGSYRLTGLDDGEYRGEFSKDGFSDSGSNPFSRVSGDTAVPVNVQLKPWGALRGRVVGEDGKPAAGVRVEKEPNSPGSLDGDTVTDENGEFAFLDLAPGSYTVVAKPRVNIRMQDGVRVGTVAIYYPSATELAEAARIPVRYGENVSGIEIRLKSVPVHRVAGVVLNEAGKPVAHATVKLMSRMETARQMLNLTPPPTLPPAAVAAGIILLLGMGTSVPAVALEPEMARVESRDDGTFEFAAVEEGDWRLSAEAGIYDDVPLGGVASAAVSEKDVEDIQIRMTAPFALQISADWGGAQPPVNPTRIENGRVTASEPAPVRLGLTALESQPRVTGDNPAINMTRLNSAFSGRYRVTQGGLQGDFYVAAVMWGGRDVKGQVVELTPGAGPFQIVYKSGLGKVRGTVEKCEGGSVLLIAQQSGEILNYRQAPCGAGGAFEMAQVVPGEYSVVAFDRTERVGLAVSDFLATIAPLASSVRVEAGSTASVDLRVNKWPW